MYVCDWCLLSYVYSTQDTLMSTQASIRQDLEGWGMISSRKWLWEVSKAWYVCGYLRHLSRAPFVHRSAALHDNVQITAFLRHTVARRRSRSRDLLRITLPAPATHVVGDTFTQGHYTRVRANFPLLKYQKRLIIKIGMIERASCAARAHLQYTQTYNISVLLHY